MKKQYVNDVHGQKMSIIFVNNNTQKRFNLKEEEEALFTYNKSCK